MTPKPVKTSNKAEDMLRFDLDNENETIRNYRVRSAPVRGARRVCPGGADPARSWCRNRITRSIWRRRSGWMCRMLPAPDERA